MKYMQQVIVIGMLLAGAPVVSAADACFDHEDWYCLVTGMDIWKSLTPIPPNTDPPPTSPDGGWHDQYWQSHAPGVMSDKYGYNEAAKLYDDDKHTEFCSPHWDFKGITDAVKPVAKGFLKGKLCGDDQYHDPCGFPILDDVSCPSISDK